MVALKQNNIRIEAGVIEGFFGKPWSSATERRRFPARQRLPVLYLRTQV
jgi:hypothetical protein